MNRYLSIFLLGILLGPALLLANNLRISNLHLIDPQHIGLLVSWENSWRLAQAPANHDAVWIFVKYRMANGQWNHVELSGLNASHVAAPPLEVKVVSDEKGVFVRRAMNGSGTLPPTLVKLGLRDPLPLGFVDLVIYGIEMVYVPEGGFFLGDSSSFHHFRKAEGGGPYWVGSENAIPVAALSVGEEASIFGQISVSYPKGYGACYVMKYELSQEQYRDFLNALSYDQQQARTTASPDAQVGTLALSASQSFSNRNGLVIATSGIAPNTPAVYACEAKVDGNLDQGEDGQNRACNFLNWQDVLAYLDWAGLRPMTEMEFEKVCRGPLAAIPGEFAWGTPHIIDANSILMDGTEEERVSETATATAGLGSHGYAGPAGPLRTGFGGTDSSDRLQIGGSYYGVLEMSGNLWELCVNVDSLGLLFDGQHGDGELNQAGDANVPNWPLGLGAIHRGGAWFSGIIAPFRDLAISDRFYHDLPPALRRNTSGGRGVRSVEW